MQAAQERSAGRKLGVISDVHGNLTALSAVLQALQGEGVNEVVCCGDLVGYGPWPNECLALLEEHRVQSVRGNHDAAGSGELDLSRFDRLGQAALRWTQKALTSASLSRLKGLPLRLALAGGLGVTHGSRADPLWGRIYRRRDAYLAFRLGGPGLQLQLFGHTHLPALFSFDGQRVQRQALLEGEAVPLQPAQRYLLNPGSVGQPRDHDWRASCCVLEWADTLSVRYRRLEYEVEATRQKIVAVGLPPELGRRLLTGD